MLSIHNNKGVSLPCTNICDCGQNRSQESSIRKASKSKDKQCSLGQQPTRYAKTTIDTNIVDEVLWFSLRERITCKILVIGNCITVKV